MRQRAVIPVAAILVALVAACAPAPAGSSSPLPEGPSAPAGSAAAASGPAAGVRPLLVDTDVAADDLVALAFLVASPQVDVRAITVSGTGEAHCAGGVDVVLRLLERLKAPPIEVACGRETPLAGDHAFPDEWRTRADAGSGIALPKTTRTPVAGSAVDLIDRTAAATDGLRVLTLGPMTNLAEAIAARPALAHELESVYVMGGALQVPGNVAFGGPPDNGVAEWNIYVDPSAAQTVVDSGVSVRLVSLDGTNQVPVTRDWAARVAELATAPGARMLDELVGANPFMTEGSYYFWDPLAAALAAGYPVGAFEPVRVDVEEAEGPQSGFTRPVDGDPNVEYLSSADAGAAERTLLDVLNGGG